MSIESLAQCVNAIERAMAGKAVSPVAVLLTTDDLRSLRAVARPATFATTLLGLPLLMPTGLEVSVFLYADGRTAPIARKAA